MTRKVEIEPLGDRALLIRLGDTIDEATHRRVRAAHVRLTPHELPGALEVVPAFTTVAVHFDPARASFAALSAAVLERLNALDSAVLPAPRLVEIPVRYGGEHGPDLEVVADHAGVTPAEVVRLHAGAEYRVHMIGFAPGFPYLGGMPARLACPRRDTPRTVVPAGSVGIGGAQTGVYPLESPGGWQLIGRTALTLFDAQREPPSLLAAGDIVRFTIEESPA